MRLAKDDTQLHDNKSKRYITDDMMPLAPSHRPADKDAKDAK